MKRQPRTQAPKIDVTVPGLLKARLPLFVFSLLLIWVNRAAGLVLPYSTKYLVDDVIARRSQSMLVALLLAIAAATLIQGISSYVLTLTMNVSSHRLIADLRKRIHQHLSKLPLAYFEANQTGVLVSRVMRDIEGVRNLLGGGLVEFFGGLATAVIAFVVLVRIDFLMTLVVFAVLALFAVVLRNAIGKYRPVYKENYAINAEVTARLTESIGGVRVVKAYRAEAQEHAVFAGGIDRWLHTTLVTTKGSAFWDLAVVAVTGVIGAVVMYFGAHGIMAGKMTLGDFLRYILFLSMLIAPLMQAVSLGTRLNEAYAGLERVQEVFAVPREDQDERRTLQINHVEGRVCFESVSFSYNGDQAVLEDIDFCAEPGTVTALVGPSGAGKSTIINLIAGFYRSTKGTIWVDDKDLSRADLHSYRAHLGIVPQDAFLFSGTIHDNVAFSRPDATPEEIRRACRLAHVDEFAGRLPEGYETIVGERGVKLSMGQRQRIAIARAILADPRILILDEATSSLDSVSEAVIQQALSFLLRDRTTFVIAHRLSTIRQADRILVIDDGRIIESGTHESLLQAQGKYWKLYTTQYELQSNLFLAPGEGDETPAAENDQTGEAAEVAVTND